MKRRAFIQSTLFTAAWAAHRPAGAGQPDRHSGKWIIPTNKPSRFGLKVMAFNPIRVPDPAAYRLSISGLVHEPLQLTTADLDRVAKVKQNSRLKCVQCWSGRVDWAGFRAQELLKLTRLKTEAGWVRIDCADRYYDFVKLDDLFHPRTLFATALQGEPLTPEHGAPLRLVLPHKYGYKSSKLITSLTFLDKGGRGLQADGMPYYSETGDILPGVDHPFEFPDDVRKIPGGEITEY
jgi:DMSO/TMAO reductase YedYZ molybdopterin-dependent catalytic subunit